MYVWLRSFQWLCLGDYSYNMETLKNVVFLRSSWPLFLVSFWIICLSIFGPNAWQIWLLVIGVVFQLLLVVTHFRYPVKEVSALGFFLYRASILFLIGVVAIFLWKVYVVNPRHANFMQKINQTSTNQPNRN
jgi:hypothetical protein